MASHGLSGLITVRPCAMHRRKLKRAIPMHLVVKTMLSDEVGVPQLICASLEVQNSESSFYQFMALSPSGLGESFVSR